MALKISRRGQFKQLRIHIDQTKGQIQLRTKEEEEDKEMEAENQMDAKQLGIKKKGYWIDFDEVMETYPAQYTIYFSDGTDENIDEPAARHLNLLDPFKDKHPTEVTKQMVKNWIDEQAKEWLKNWPSTDEDDDE